ncbi:sugar kinase [Microbacterium awajiense]|uniref:Sugar kinase n=1 Tax=Microbacterium awajiense TaxID=415214 RepID=A0ABP7AS33_9MICO
MTVLCVGETMAQIVPIDGARLVDAETFAMTAAGAESNVAVSLSRLGSAARWASRVGDDPVGTRVVQAVTAAGVDTSLVERVAGARTGMFLKDPSSGGSAVHYYRVGSAASRMDTAFADVMLATAPRWIHFTGVTVALSESTAAMADRLLDGAGRSGIPVSFDVNYRSSLWSSRPEAARRLRQVASRADVVFVGLDEAQSLWGIETPDDVRALLPAVKTVIVKDGPVECVSFDGERVLRMPALEVDVVEPVGAGDAFAAGYIHARIARLEPLSQLRLAHLNAGVALRSHSDTGPLDGAIGLVSRACTGIDWPDALAATAQQNRRDHASI